MSIPSSPNQPKKKPACLSSRSQPKKRRVDPARQIAFETLQAISSRNAYANLLLPYQLEKNHLTGRDAALATELVYGVCRMRGLLDVIISTAAKRPLSAIDTPLRDLLRLGAYQLLYTRIDSYAAVSTTVDHAYLLCGQSRAGFVNAILRAISRHNLESWIDQVTPNQDHDPIGYLACIYSHPRWIVQAFSERLSNDTELESLLISNNTRPSIHLATRANCDLHAQQLAEMVGGTVGKYSPYAVYLPAGNPAQLIPIRDHQAFVQDEGSQLVAHALAQAPLQGNDQGRWLDLCAGPGGKTTLLAALASQRNAFVTAIEPNASRARLVEHNTEGLPVKVYIADGRTTGLVPGFDRILVDAPCSGLGVLRRRPEARWHHHDSDIATLVKLQQELLTAAIALVRPGGVILYSTCSPHQAETIDLITTFTATQPIRLLDTPRLFPTVDQLDAHPWVQLWPHRHGTDAMFAAAFQVLAH